MPQSHSRQPPGANKRSLPAHGGAAAAADSKEPQPKRARTQKKQTKQQELEEWNRKGNEVSNRLREILDTQPSPLARVGPDAMLVTPVVVLFRFAQEVAGSVTIEDRETKQTYPMRICQLWVTDEHSTAGKQALLWFAANKAKLVEVR